MDWYTVVPALRRDLMARVISADECEAATVHELMEQLRRDIIFDAHSWAAKMRRSVAKRELVKRGESAFPGITEVLRGAFDADEDIEVLCAYSQVLLEAGEAAGYLGPDQKTLRLGETSEWLAWAERMLSS